jgi:hypothetical protein
MVSYRGPFVGRWEGVDVFVSWRGTEGRTRNGRARLGYGCELESYDDRVRMPRGVDAGWFRLSSRRGGEGGRPPLWNLCGPKMAGCRESCRLVEKRKRKHRSRCKKGERGPVEVGETEVEVAVMCCTTHLWLAVDRSVGTVSTQHPVADVGDWRVPSASRFRRRAADCLTGVAFWRGGRGCESGSP